MAKEVTRKLGTLLEVFGRSIAAFPLAEAVRAVVHVHGLDVLVECFWCVKERQTEHSRAMLPKRLLV